MVETIDLAIELDENGNGREITKKVSGFLVLAYLNGSMVEQTRVMIYPKSMPELLIELKKKDMKAFRIKMDTVDMECSRGPQMDDVPLDDSLVVEVISGIPDTNFNVKILYVK